MIKKLLRGTVHIIPNDKGSTYEATDNADIMRINLCQETVWFNNGELCVQTRVVTHDTNISIYKTGHVLPGNILVGYTLEPLTENPEEYMLYDERGIVCTQEGYPVYYFYYYAPMSRYQHRGILKDDDVLETLLGTN